MEFSSSALFRDNMQTAVLQVRRSYRDNLGIISHISP